MLTGDDDIPDSGTIHRDADTQDGQVCANPSCQSRATTFCFTDQLWHCDDHASHATGHGSGTILTV